MEFLRKLKRRGLAVVRLVISDAHEGIKTAVVKMFRATWQRCRVHFMRNALAHAGRSGRRVVSAFIATAFAQNGADSASQQWRRVADQPGAVQNAIADPVTIGSKPNHPLEMTSLA
ncbi:transposase-like protein [Constrictibacter sp. MBR-5]